MPRLSLSLTALICLALSTSCRTAAEQAKLKDDGSPLAGSTNDPQSILSNPTINYEFHLKSADGNCFDPFAVPAAFATCKEIHYPDPLTAGHNFTFLSASAAGSGFRAQLRSQKTGGCLTVIGGALSVTECKTPADATQDLALRLKKQGDLDIVTIMHDGSCLTYGQGQVATLETCDANDARQSLTMSIIHDNLCVHGDADGAADLVSLQPQPPWTDAVTLIWGDCLNKGILFRSVGFDVKHPENTRAVALATTGAEASVMTTDDHDRVFWGDLSGHIFVYSIAQGAAVILDQYGPHHGSPQLGAGRPHVLAYQKKGDQELLIIKDLGRWLVRDLKLAPSPASTTALKLLDEANPNEPIDGELHHGIVNGQTPRVDRSGNIFGLGDQKFQQRVWLNRQTANGQWHHRFLGTIGGQTTQCSDMTYNASTDSFYALCKDGIWKLQIVHAADQSPQAQEALNDISLQGSQLLSKADVGGITPKAAQVLGPEERVFIYDEGCRCILQRIKTGGHYEKGADLLSGVINNIWETAVRAAPAGP